MRIGKRNLRNRVRYGFQVYFNKRGDRIPHPSSIQFAIEEGNIPSLYLNPEKYERMFQKFHKQYLPKIEKMRYRRVELTSLPNGIVISTVFLTLNHSFRDPSVPVLFETMVFAPIEECDLDCYRYTRLADAKKGHAKVVKKYKKVKIDPSTFVAYGPSE